MSLRHISVLLLILAGLGAYVYLIEVPREEREEQARALFEIDSADVDRLVVERGDTSIEIVRKDDTWRLTSPIDAKADAAAVNSLVDAVAECQVEKELGAIGDDLERFGLKQPLVSLTLHSGDTEPRIVRVGKAAPVGDAAYIQRGPDGNVLLASAAFRSAVDKQLDDLRERRLFDFEDDDVRWLEIRQDALRVRLERDENDRWKMTQPAEFAADEGAIRTYLASLSALRVATFVADAPESLEPYALDTPTVEVAFALEDAPDSPTIVQFGGEQTETEIYARVDGASAVYTVNDWAFRNLDKSARDLRDKGLLRFAAEDAHAIDVMRKNGDDFRLVRDGNRWRIDGADGKVKQEEVEQYVKDLAELSGYEIVTDDAAAPAAAFGFDDPQLQISVSGAENAPLGSVIVGKTEADGGLQNFNARHVDRPTVVLLRSYIVNRLDRDPATLIEGAPAPAADNPG